MSIEFTFVPGTHPNDRSAATPFFFDPQASAAAVALVEDAGFQSVVIDGAAGLLSNFDLAATRRR